MTKPGASAPPPAAKPGLMNLDPGQANTVTAKEFDEIRSLAHRVFGLDLKTGKEALVSARLAKRVRDLQLESISHYLELLRHDGTGNELLSLIDALTTNFTSFQREPQHFNYLRKTVLDLIRNQRGTLNIWSAGCSTGEEPYTVLMNIADELGDAALDRVHLVASDISRRALGAAQAGVYDADRLRNLPEKWHSRFFQKGTGSHAGEVRIKPYLREKIEFRRVNLMEPFESIPSFHLIFCRNVMIYFDKPTQERLIGKFSTRLEPGGWLFIGHSEGLMGIQHDLEYVMPAIYRRSGGRR